MPDKLPEIVRTPITYHEIRQLVGKDDGTILEIGANNGSASRAFSKAFPHADIHCFEPDPRAIDKWRARDLPSRVKLWPMGVGAQDGTATFYVSNGREESYPGGWDKSGSIKQPKRHLERFPQITFDKTITIDVVTLDKWREANGVSTIDFIWADVQGAEEDLILGGKNSLKSTRYFYTEYNNKELYSGQINIHKILEMLPDFEILTLYPGDVLLKNRNI